MNDLRELVKDLEQISKETLHTRGDKKTKEAFFIKKLIELSDMGSEFEVTLRDKKYLNHNEGLINHKGGETFTVYKMGFPVVDFTIENLVSLKLIIPFFEREKWERK